MLSGRQHEKFYMHTKSRYVTLQESFTYLDLVQQSPTDLEAAGGLTICRLSSSNQLIPVPAHLIWTSFVISC